MYCKPAMLVYNSYAAPNLDHLSSFEVAIGRKGILAPKFEYKPYHTYHRNSCSG